MRFNNHLLLFLGIFYPLTVFTFDVKFIGKDNRECANVKMDDVVLLVKPTSKPADNTTKLEEYKIVFDSTTTVVKESSTCFSESGSAVIVVKCNESLLSIQFNKSVKDAKNPAGIIVSRFEVDASKANLSTTTNTTAPSPPPKLVFDVKDILLPNDYTSYTCEKSFTYSLENKAWSDYNITNFNHTAILMAKNIFFQLNSTAITTPKGFNCSYTPIEQKSMVVPIAVGASLASLLLIILVILLVVKKRGRRAEYDPLVNNN